MVTCHLCRLRNREPMQQRRRRQRERHETIGFNQQYNGSACIHTFWFIVQPFSAKEQREMTKFKAFCRT